MTTRRCEAQTRKGTCCKGKATAYHVHQDGEIWLACLLCPAKIHAAFGTKPYSWCNPPRTG